MSPPLTVARKYSSFHVCGGKEMSCRRAEVVVVVGIGPGLYGSFFCPFYFCPDCREEDQHKVRSLLTEIYGGGLHVIGVLQQNHFEI